MNKLGDKKKAIDFLEKAERLQKLKVLCAEGKRIDILKI
jgi:hypothetical protein